MTLHEFTNNCSKRDNCAPHFKQIFHFTYFGSFQLLSDISYFPWPCARQKIFCRFYFYFSCFLYIWSALYFLYFSMLVFLLITFLCFFTYQPSLQCHWALFHVILNKTWLFNSVKECSLIRLRSNFTNKEIIWIIPIVIALVNTLL